MPLDPFGDRPDNINPSHYRAGDIEAIDAMKACLTPEEFRGYLKGNALKYLWRERNKGGGDDILKALWYVERIAMRDGEDAEGAQEAINRSKRLFKEHIESARKWNAGRRDFENAAEMTMRYAEWIKGLQDASDGAD